MRSALKDNAIVLGSDVQLTSLASAQSINLESVCEGSCPALILLCTVERTSELWISTKGQDQGTSEMDEADARATYRHAAYPTPYACYTISDMHQGTFV